MAFPTGYTKYQEVTIDNTKVSADLTDFPVYIDLSDLDLATDIFDTCRTDGGDIRVTKTDGTTELAREVVAIDTTGKTGELHVKFTGTLSSSVDTVIRIYYNGTDTEPASTATYGSEAVWGDYEGVWHCQSGLEDSSGTQTTGTVTGATNTADKIENGYDFDGSNDKLDLERVAGVESASNVTLQSWHSSDLSTDSCLYNKGDYGGSDGIQFYYEASPVTIFMTFKNINNRFVYPVTEMTSNQKHMLHAVMDGAGSVNSDRFKLYQDGSDNTSAGSFVGTMDTTATTGTSTLSTGESGGGAHDMNGTQDEIRLRLTSLSSTWISTEYNNQNSPSTFYSVSAEVGGGGATANNSARRLHLMSM